MVTAHPPAPDIAEPAEAEIATELDGTPGEAGEDQPAGEPAALSDPVMPTIDAPAISSNEAAGELPIPRVIAIANQKGGVGKTTTAVNLGAALAESGFRVLVVDLDPQGNASTGLGHQPRDVESSIYDVIMTDAPALDCVEPTSLKNLFVLPATIDLAGAEIELVSAFSRELKLRRALDLVLRPEYDIILIDCPPSLGLLTVNGLAAADDVIVPVQSEYYALEGLGQLLKNVAMVRSLNPTLDVRGIVLTMHDSRTKLAEQVESEVRRALRSEGLQDGCPEDGAPLGGAVVRAADHRVRSDVAGRDGVPGTGERGEWWRDAADSVRDSGRSSPRGRASIPTRIPAVVSRSCRRRRSSRTGSSPAATSTRRRSARSPTRSARSACSSPSSCDRSTTATS